MAYDPLVVPANFPLGYAEELAANKIRVRATNGFFWPEREAKSEKEVEMMGRALRITEKGLTRAIEVLKASKPGAGKRLRWTGKTLTSEILRAEIDSAILRAGGMPANTIVAGGDQACDPHERGYGPLYADSLIILDIFPRDAKSGYFGDMTRTVVARPRERSAAQALGNGESRPGAGVEENEARRRWDENSQGNPGIFRRHAVIRPKCAEADASDFFTAPVTVLGWRFTSIRVFKKLFSKIDRC